FMSGPSVQVSVHHCRANNSSNANAINVTWDELSGEDTNAIFGWMPGPTREQDMTLFPTDEVFEEASKHYHREWNPYCDSAFRRICKALEDGRGKCWTKGEWKDYFHSGNHGINAPPI
ncbi:hypothetical protein C8R43DRAFT_864747, partial [Mycena crocata]